MLLKELRSAHHVDVVDLSVGSQNDGSVTARRLFEVAKLLARVWWHRRDTDAVYLTVSESFVGNLKDLFIYGLCVGRLSKLHIHLHGGSIGSLLFDKHGILRRLNGLFMRRFASAIVTGPTHASIFADMIPAQRVHSVPNFAEDDLFAPEDAIRLKFASCGPYGSCT